MCLALVSSFGMCLASVSASFLFLLLARRGRVWWCSLAFLESALGLVELSGLWWLVRLRSLEICARTRSGIELCYLRKPRYAQRASGACVWDDRLLYFFAEPRAECVQGTDPSRLWSRVSKRQRAEKARAG